MSEALTIIVKGDAAQFTRTMQTVDRAIQKAQGSVRSFGHSTTSNTQAASAAIRLLEGDMTNMVRAAENFVGRSRMLSGVLKTAFPVIGAVAIGAVIAEGTQRLLKFIETANRVPQALQNAFASSNLTITASNDALQKSNDELRNQISLLENRPGNDIALALDDARIAADKLAKSLGEDRKQFAAMLKENSLGMFAGVLTHQGNTNGTAGLVNYWSQQLQQRGNAVVIAQHQYGVGSSQDKTAQAALAQRQRDAEASVRQRLSQLQAMQRHHVSGWRSMGSGATADQTGNIDIAQGYLSQLYGRDNEASLESDNAKLQAKKSQLENSRKLSEQQKKANEQVEKNVRDILTQRRQNDQQMADYARTPGLIAPHRLLGMNGQAGAAPQGLALNRDLSQNSEMTKGLGDASKAAVGWLKNMNDGVAIQKANADALAEQSLQMAIATGRISRLDAAQVQAQLHTQEYTETLRQLQSNRAAITARTDLSPLDRKQQLSGIDNQIATLNGERAMQSRSDQAAIQAATTMGQLRDATAQLAIQFKDLGGQLSTLAVETINGINQSLATALVSHASNGQEYRRNITNALSGQARQLGARGLNMAFQQVEGGLFGKRADGSSAASALWVRMAGVGGAVASGASSVGSGISGLWGRLVSRLPHFAGGGSTPSNMPIVVGENGPEIFNPGMAGQVIPNHRLASSLGSTHTSISVDARGSNDPAAVHAAAQRAVLAAVPHILAASQAKAADDRRRTVGNR
jgi:hypothetical protein